MIRWRYGVRVLSLAYATRNLWKCPEMVLDDGYFNEWSQKTSLSVLESDYLIRACCPLSSHKERTTKDSDFKGDQGSALKEVKHLFSAQVHWTRNRDSIFPGIVLEERTLKTIWPVTDRYCQFLVYWHYLPLIIFSKMMTNWQTKWQTEERWKVGQSHRYSQVVDHQWLVWLSPYSTLHTYLRCFFLPRNIEEGAEMSVLRFSRSNEPLHIRRQESRSH